MTDALGLVAAALAAVVGGTFLLVGLWYLNALRAVTLSRVTAPGRVAPGVTEVLARVQPAGETLTAPLSGESCVGYVLRTERRGEGVRSLFGRRWERTATRSELVPFRLVDGSGRVLVRPVPGADDGAEPWPGDPPDDFFTDLELTVDTRETVAAGDDRPDGLDGGPADGERRYTEWRIAPGDALYVLGRARREDDADAPMGIANDSGPFIVSETPQWRTALNRLLRGLAYLLVGGALLAYAAVASGAF